MNGQQRVEGYVETITSRSGYQIAAMDDDGGAIFVLKSNLKHVHVFSTSPLIKLEVIELSGERLMWVRDVVYFAGFLFVTDIGHHWVAKIDIETGVVSQLAGNGRTGNMNGTGKNVGFYHPWGIAVDPDTQCLFVADCHNDVIRKIQLQLKVRNEKGRCRTSIENAVVTTFAGRGGAGWIDGDGDKARFHYPNGICMGQDGVLYVTEQNNLRGIISTDKGRIVSTIVGEPANTKRRQMTNKRKHYFHPTMHELDVPLTNPHNVVQLLDGSLCIIDYGKQRIQHVTRSKLGEVNVRTVSTRRPMKVRGGLKYVPFGDLSGMTIDKWGECLYFMDEGDLCKLNMHCSPKWISECFDAINQSDSSQRDTPVEVLQLIIKFSYRQAD